MAKALIAALLALCILALPMREAFAHGGGLNRDGCHHETATGGYHYHRGGNDDGGADLQGKSPCEAARAKGKARR